MECIILAGGFGTRLQGVVSDVPKCMAPVAGKPFLAYLFSSLEEAGFTHIILSLGYKHEVIENWLSTLHTKMKISYVVETEPLGTGGAVKFAASVATEEAVFILNGDTYFGVNYAEMLQTHHRANADATLALRQMYNFERYGVVETDATTGRILQFREKQFCLSGLINGGVYLIRREVLNQLPNKCSLEKEYFETHLSSAVLTGYPSNGFFIDIGIPEDYTQAQLDFKDGKYKML